MGARLVLAAFEVAWMFDANPKLILVRMAVTALDDDPEPWYGAGWRPLAAAIGHVPLPSDEKGEKNAIEAVRVAMLPLVGAGRVSVRRRGAPGRNAHYGLHLFTTPRAHPGVSAGATPRAHPGRHPGLIPDDTPGSSRTTPRAHPGAEEEGGGTRRKEEPGTAATKPVDSPPEPAIRGRRKVHPRAGYPEHEHEPNALATLTRVHDERHLPLDVEELLYFAYRIGGGDPWKGWQAMEAKTNERLDDVQDPAKVLRYRLGYLAKGGGS